MKNTKAAGMICDQTIPAAVAVYFRHLAFRHQYFQFIIAYGTFAVFKAVRGLIQLRFAFLTRTGMPVEIPIMIPVNSGQMAQRTSVWFAENFRFFAHAAAVIGCHARILAGGRHGGFKFLVFVPAQLTVFLTAGFTYSFLFTGGRTAAMFLGRDYRLRHDHHTAC